MKVYDAPNIRNVAVVGPRRLRQDLARLRPALRRRRREPARPRRRRHHGHRLRPRRDRAEDQPARGARLRRVEEGQDQPDRRAGLRELPVRGALGAARGRRRRSSWSTRWRASRCRPRRSGATPRRAASRAWSSSTAWTATTPRSSGRSSGSRRRSGAPRCRSRCRSARARRFKGIVDLVSREGAALRGRRERQVPGGGGPRGAGRRRPKAWREKLVEMVAESNEELMEEFFEKGTLSEEQLGEGAARAPSARAGSVPVLPASSLRNVGVHAAPRRDRGPAAVARGPRRGRRAVDPRARPRPHAQAGGRRAALGVRLEDARRPARRPHQPVPRLLGHAQVRLGASTTRAATSAERVGSLLLLQGKAQTQCPRSRPATSAPSRSSRTPRPATRSRDKAHPIVYPQGRLPGARHHVRDRAQDARRRRQDLDRAAAADGGGPGAARLARRADPRDAALGRGPAPHRGRRRAACASATRSRSTSRSRRSRTARRSRPRPRATAATRSRPAATASSATARSA